MKKYWSWIIAIEVQVVLGLIIFFSLSLEKQKNNNRILVKKITELEGMIYEQNLTEIHSNDLIIGEDNAPVEIVMYTRFDCPICQEFFETSYSTIKKEFIETGQVKLIVRNLVHQTKERNLHLTSVLHQINNSTEIPHLNKMSLIDNILINGAYSDSIKLPEPQENLETELLERAKHYRSMGVKSTPTFFINGNKIIGNRSIDRFRSLIKNSTK